MMKDNNQTLNLENKINIPQKIKQMEIYYMPKKIISLKQLPKNKKINLLIP